MEIFIQNIIAKTSMIQLNILILIGFVLFGGTIGGRLFQKLKIPQVVGYIIIGIILGQSCLKIINKEIIIILQPFNYFSLGIIGFMIGGELKRSVFKRYGKQFFCILIFEGMMAFLLVLFSITLVSFMVTHDLKLSISLGLILGSIASATAPAATTDVLWEYKARGPLTTTVFGIVALDDGLALVLFAFASSLAAALMGTMHGSILYSVLYPLYEIFGSLFVGGGFGLLLGWLLKKFNEEDRILVFSIGSILMALGLSLTLKVDMLLSSMAMGIVITNFSPHASKEIFKITERFTPPIYVMFFVLVGAKLELSNITFYIGILILVYFLFRTSGKMLGAKLGSKIAHASESVQKYLPYCLFSQAGVAIGLAILVSQKFPSEIGDIAVIVVMTSTFVVQLIGPSFVRMAVVKAGENGLNVTEDDLIKSSKVKDLMDYDIPTIYENMPITKVLNIFSEYDYFYYPVVNENKKLVGVLTIDNLKNMFIVSELNHFLLVHDILEPVPSVVFPQTSLLEAVELLKNFDVEYLPITDNKGKVLGILESRSIKKYFTKKMIEFNKKAEALS